MKNETAAMDGTHRNVPGEWKDDEGLVRRARSFGGSTEILALQSEEKGGPLASGTPGISSGERDQPGRNGKGLFSFLVGTSRLRSHCCHSKF